MLGRNRGARAPKREIGKPEYRCSFCGKSQEDVRGLIAGPGPVYICNECVDLGREVFDEGNRFVATTSGGTVEPGPGLGGVSTMVIENRKADHIRICLEEDVSGQNVTTG